MKPVKHPLSSSSKLADVPELNYKKGLLNSPLSPKLKEKQSSKLVHEKLEPVVLSSPPTGESIVRYALPIPSSKTKELIAEDELLRKITKQLKMVVSSLEETYGSCSENVEKPVVKSEREELSLSLGDNLNSFLECCSQFTAQLDEAAKEEHHILDSLFKWFQRQVNQMEEVSKDQSFSEAELPAPDKTVTFSIERVVKHLQKLEELKARLQERSTPSLHIMLAKPKIGETPLETVQSYEKVQEKIEEFIKTHAPEGFTDVTGPNIKLVDVGYRELFINLTPEARRVKKYKQILNDLQVLSEEKLVLQNELQRLRNSEKSYDRTRKTMKMDKKKPKEKSEVSEEKKSSVKELKTEELLKAQKIASALETENKILQEQLKRATQEADKARHQLKYFLNQGELLKSDMKNKATVENNNSKRDIKGKDPKSIPLDIGTRIAEVADSSEQKTNANIQEQPQLLVILQLLSLPTESSVVRL
ncbi:coiled-coil domain-containing protein 7 [Saccopteryx bilineata]|uniref:coiled-coil domain-containing protein 7 n=1 Tax=Saccopteryx bilineata TaxID=59482 RepID=UPI00338D9723